MKAYCSTGGLAAHPAEVDHAGQQTSAEGAGNVVTTLAPVQARMGKGTSGPLQGVEIEPETTEQLFALGLEPIAAVVLKEQGPIYLEGRPVPSTRSFEEREPPYRAMDDPRLRRQLEVEEAKVRAIVSEVLVRDPAAVIPWTGRQMVVAKLIPHMRTSSPSTVGTSPVTTGKAPSSLASTS